MTFVSTKVEQDGDDLTVIGDLTMNGVTRQVELDAEFDGRGMSPFGMEVIGFSGKTKISREDFGITWNAALETGGVLVANDVKISLHIEAVPAQG
jgi:polyisoprenoid-binding protein YceI